MKCPYCKKVVDSDASICPYCNRNISLFSMATREPFAFRIGVLTSILASFLSVIIHYEFIRDSVLLFKNDPGCCLCLTAPIMFLAFILVGIYSIVGFFIGYFLALKYDKNKK